MSLEGNISWHLLKNIADTLDSYRVRVFIDAKEEILKANIYNEEQYYDILFKMFEDEMSKYSLYHYLNQNDTGNLKLLKKFTKLHSLDLAKTLSLLELLFSENLVKVDYLYDTIKDETNESEDKIFKDLAIRTTKITPSEIKSIYEPIKVIFDSKNCSGCGLCVGLCPVNCIELNNGIGKIDDDKCIRCGLCYYFCPRTYLPVNLLNMVQENTSEIPSPSKLGFYSKAYSARTKVREISERCQDGGISSTCLYYLFEQSKIDYALGASMSKNPWRPEPILMKNREDILLTTGTKYVNNPSLSLMNQLNSNPCRLAIVGVPCMMQSLLKSKIYDLHIPSQNSVVYRIGIFCMESFSYESFLKICDILNVNVDDVKKTDINKGKFFIYTNKGEELTIPIKEITHLAREDCKVCYDLTSESADISIGSTGSPSGWNTVLIRTEKGKGLYEALLKNDLIESKSLKAVKPGLPSLEKVAASKKKKCSTHVAKKKTEHMRTPSY
jgi:coenzyme F420 hydrogenase subunit beta